MKVGKKYFIKNLPFNAATWRGLLHFSFNRTYRSTTVRVKGIAVLRSSEIMANIPKLGQFGHTFKRGVVRTVEQRAHTPGEGPEKLWRNISVFVGLPSMILAMVNAYMKHEHRERPEPLAYPHLKIMNKPFPWGDGKHSLFHHPKNNYLPGIGYEE